MRTDVVLPQVELTMESATIARWLVTVGDRVTAEQPLLEVETQKAVTEVPSPTSGYVRKLCAKEGETVGAKALLCVLTDNPEEPLDGAAGAAEPVRASPAARRLAKERGVDLSAVTGTGPEGRVTEADVLAASAIQPTGRAPAPTQDSAAAGVGSSDGWTTLPRTRLALIAQMQKSLAEIPQIHIRRQLDVTPLCVRTNGISFTHRLVIAVASALREHPALRTGINGGKVKVLPVNVAIAIDSANGLVAPVIRNADALSLEQVAVAVKELRERAQADALRRDELLGGTPFAISNLGMLDVDQFDAFVFHGQTAVLSVGKAVDRPSGGGGRLAWFGLAVDHRVVDGAEAARFLQTLQTEILRP